MSITFKDGQLYIKNDTVNFFNTPYASMYGDCVRVPHIKKVIFNPPATIVLWKDDTKTVVKCGENDIYDPEKGLAMAIAKKALGNKGNYFNEIKKWTEGLNDGAKIALDRTCKQATQIGEAIKKCNVHIKKMIPNRCHNCAHSSRAGWEEPCNLCILSNNKDRWEPKDETCQ